MTQEMVRVIDRDMGELDELLEDRCGAMARRWQRALAGTSYVPLSSREILKHLLDLTDRLIAIVVTDPFAPTTAREVGASLVALHYTQPESLGMTMEVFGVHLLADLDAAHQHALGPRLGAALGELATGFTGAMRTTILAEQES